MRLSGEKAIEHPVEPAGFSLEPGFREGRLDELQTSELIGQFTDDCDAGLFTWVPLTGTIILPSGSRDTAHSV